MTVHEIAPRTHTPDRQITTPGGATVTRVKVKRACNGCSSILGDLDDRDVDDRGELVDVRAECDHCRPLVALESAGCDVRQLTPRTIGELWQWIESGKPYRVLGGDGLMRLDGLSVYNPDASDPADRRHVARYGDWIIHHPDGRWTVHKAPSSPETTGRP